MLFYYIMFKILHQMKHLNDSDKGKSYSASMELILFYDTILY